MSDYRKVKQLGGKEQGTKEDIRNAEFLKRKYLKQIEEDAYLIDRDKVNAWYGYYWDQVLNWVEYHPDQPVINVAVVAGKSTRKSTVFAVDIFQRVSQFPWLQGAFARDTKTRSDTEIHELIGKCVDISGEYQSEFLKDIIEKGTGAYYYKKHEDRKDNQKMLITSFEEITERGGFVRPTITLQDELVNPKATPREIPTKEEFLYGVELINSKNRENFLSVGQNFEDFATNLFAMNRWRDHPIIDFCEEHFPYDPIEEKFLEDPINNNFAVKYVGEANDGWKELNKTLIIYTSKFSNDMITDNEELVNELISKLEQGNQRDKGIILGSKFDISAFVKSPNTFNESHWYMHNKLPKEPNKVFFGADFDFNEEICLSTLYEIKFDEREVIDHYGQPVYAYIAKLDKLKLEKDTSSGKTVYSAKWLINKMKENIKGLDVEKSKKIAFIDDNQELLSDIFNRKTGFDVYDTKSMNTFFRKAIKHGAWSIERRQGFLNSAVPIGFLSLLKGFAAEELKAEMDLIRVQEGTKKRDERPGKNKLNKTNCVEYSATLTYPKLKKFPPDFWEWYNENMLK